MGKEEAVLCPVCENKTHTKVEHDTVLTNFPLFCPKCKKVTHVNVSKFIITKIIKEPDAKTQSR